MSDAVTSFTIYLCYVNRFGLICSYFLCLRRVPVPDARFDYLVEYHKPAR